MPTIRPMRESDAVEVLALDPIVFPDEVNWTMDDFNCLYDSKYSFVFCDEMNNDQIIGFVVAGKFKDREEYLISNLGIHPDYRRRGLASELMSTTIKAIRNNCPADVALKINLQVKRTNDAAIALYARMDFIIDTPSSNPDVAIVENNMVLVTTGLKSIPTYADFSSTFWAEAADNYAPLHQGYTFK